MMPPFYPTPLSDALKAYRQKTGLTVRELAFRSGLPLDTVRALETDLGLPTADQVSVLCDLLGVAPYQVLRYVKASVRRMVLEALQPAEAQALAARHLEGDPAPEVRPEVPLPGPVQAAIARQEQPSLAYWRQLPVARQARWAEAVAVDVELAGDDRWPAEP